MVVVVPFLVESELFHGGVVEDRWLSVASRAHQLKQGRATANCAAAAVLPRAFQALTGPSGGGRRTPQWGGGGWWPDSCTHAAAGAARSGCLRSPAL